MVRRASRGPGAAFEKKLAVLARVRDERPADAADVLRPLLADESHVIASQAAELAGELELETLAPELEAAFERVLAGSQQDRGCSVARATVHSLGTLHIPAGTVYRKALTLVHHERVGATYVDVGISVRVGAAAALVETEGEDALFDIVPLLADPEPDVRAGVVRALGGIGTTAAAAAIHTKLVAGDRSDDVLGAACGGLLLLDAARFAPLVIGYLSSPSDDLASLVAFELAEARAPGALDALLVAAKHANTGRARALFVAIATLRDPHGEAFLFEKLRTAPEKTAVPALEALAIYRGRPEEARVREIVAERGGPLLMRALARAFG